MLRDHVLPEHIKMLLGKVLTMLNSAETDETSFLQNIFPHLSCNGGGGKQCVTRWVFIW